MFGSTGSLFDDVPWPAAGDVLFTEGPNSWMNAQLSLSRFSDGAYSAGYRSAGDALVEQAAAPGGAPDLLVYPIVFCYRQYLELELKDLITIARRVHGIEHKPSGVSRPRPSLGRRARAHRAARSRGHV